MSKDSRRRARARRKVGPAPGGIFAVRADALDAEFEVTADQRDILLAGAKLHAAPLRRPADTPRMLRYLVLNGNMSGALARSGRDDLLQKLLLAGTPSVGASTAQAQASVANDSLASAYMASSQTVLYYADPRFCDLLTATDAPPVIDLTPLLRSGNQAIFCCFATAIPNRLDGDAAIVGLAAVLADGRDFPDGRDRLICRMAHGDTGHSLTTSVHPVDRLEPGSPLARVGWTTGYNLRTAEAADEPRTISNTLSLLAQAQTGTGIFHSDRWTRYTKAERTEQHKDRRRLPPINLVSLAPRTAQGLDEYDRGQSAPVEVSRDGWWPVRGHFRLQPYGPGRKLVHQVYVHPCVKGNTAGPCIGRAQVRVARAPVGP